MPKFYVHRNLNRTCWSVLLRGKLCGYRREVTLRDVEFRVRPGGYARYLRQATRNVHAFVVGTISRGVPQGKRTRIRYDLDYGKFVDLNGKAYTHARAVRMDKNGQVWGYGLSTLPSSSG